MLLNWAKHHAVTTHTGVHQSHELWHHRCWSASLSNILKGASVKWMMLQYYSTLPIHPEHSKLRVEAGKGWKYHITNGLWTNNLPNPNSEALTTTYVFTHCVDKKDLEVLCLWSQGSGPVKIVNICTRWAMPIRSRWLRAGNMTSKSQILCPCKF